MIKYQVILGISHFNQGKELIVLINKLEALLQLLEPTKSVVYNYPVHQLFVQTSFPNTSYK